MKVKIYQVDAFASKPFTGNPAAVCPLKEWLPDETMQHIAMENNLAETAFYVVKENQPHIRWFTPKTEVDLCGHATLATAHVMFHHENYNGNAIHFDSRSGILVVERNDNQLTLDFPTDTIKEVEGNELLSKALGLTPHTLFKGKTDFMAVFEHEQDVRSLQPDLRLLQRVDARGVIVTAPGKNVDFVSRFFGPAVGVDEDPVTGSAHTTLTPYWAGRLGKTQLVAEQLSHRGGRLECRFLDDRTKISGQAVTYLEGDIFV